MCLVQGPQRSDAGEARTRGPSVSSQALYHWATALPVFVSAYCIILCAPIFYTDSYQNGECKFWNLEETKNTKIVPRKNRNRRSLAHAHSYISYIGLLAFKEKTFTCYAHMFR